MILKQYLFQKLIDQIKNNKSDLDLMISQYTSMVEITKEISKIPECINHVDSMISNLSEMKKTIKSMLYKTESLVEIYKDIIKNS